SKDSNNQIYEIYAIELAAGDIKPWVSGPGGAVRPTPSPDGDYLAFVRRIRADTALFIQNRNSGELTPIFDNLTRDMQETWAIHGVYPNFAWLPDGKDIVFYANGGIHRVNVASKEVTQIPFKVADQREIRQAVTVSNEVAKDEFTTKMLRWLQVRPDGKQALFQALGYLYTVNLTNGRPERLTKQTDHFELYPRYSADGKQIIYSTWHDKDLGTVRLAKLNGRSQQLTKQPGHYVNPVLSPNGQTAVFQAIKGGYLTSPLYSHDTGIFKIDMKSGEQSKLADSGSEPFFTGNNDRIYFTGNDKKGEVFTGQLYSTDLSGNDKQQHYQGEWISHFKVSPDEKWLAFIQNFQVYVTPFVRNGQYIATGSGAKNLPLQKFSTYAGKNLTWSR